MHMLPTMRPTRKIIADFVAVFLIGAVIGALVARWSYTETQATAFMSHAADKPDSIVARLNKKYADEYHLTPEEMNRIQPMLSDMAQRAYQLRHQFGTDFIAAFDEYHQKIAEQLNPDHRAVYEKATEDRRKILIELLLPDQSSPNAVSK